MLTARTLLMRSCVAQPQDAYGLEKLASEELAKHYDTDFGIECRIARYNFVANLPCHCLSSDCSCPV